ncbi:hypothetical protein [Methylobacterium sp. SyP6R]|uniref:hypothetical protein n=1 Tax=Methylobacterium sp. SyP6R TaxID=2718876 RepID=UPI001F2DA829|nr:hypothetical protein [Methylobacterium sp. SyP6R]MCF4124959.1 hypothetical protein [Methylobacterium sp. SyP6R]
MQTAVSGGEQRTRVANRYAELARSIFIIRGYAEPGNARLGQIVTEAMAGASAEELRSPDTIGVSATRSRR